ncbi:hypothetical protein PENANT_c001G04539 [Penicillium antarcticum]|uniref:Uncharacterized protein n=1 Tax=Penicillium antarcticum TaxID=416450 RepID=A0A1V6QQ06_9EURO|nr:uncharacterized protein N7508_010065 [Penicillium antarcticum]KAJ5295244.1 hypothetical protein N7508_010065 [Penicillium antarcticum]OQD91026.1 hypothetical protein PENANT_c001G04539 [Penicillium antarcticum]
MSTSIEGQPQVPAPDNAAPEIAKQESVSQSVSQPKESVSQSVSQPQTTENKDHAVSSGNVENAGNAGSSENAEKTMDQGRRGTAAIMEDHHVSREALKGPTGAAKHTAEEFEQEKKTGKPAGGSVAEGDGSTVTKDHTKGDKSKSTEHKQSTMEKMKEKLAHPLHGKKSE